VSPGAALGAMTVGTLLATLTRLPRSAKVWVGSGRYRWDHLVSYRGYYEDLALVFVQRGDRPQTAGALAGLLSDAIGRVFVGYKGGGYVARTDTAVWVAPDQHTSSGNAIVRVEERPSGYELVVERIDP
jgi:hypothetical protein